MVNVIIDTQQGTVETPCDVYLMSPDLKALLVDWISELLYIFEVDEIVFREFRVKKIIEEEGEYSITAQALGEKYYPESHPFETEIKAVTYNQLEIVKTATGWRAQVVVDI